jgi:hypothetical protein
MIDAFAHRFRGNTHAYGGDDGFAVKRPVSRSVMDGHLQGHTGIGIYPIRMMDGQPHVQWGCCDIDTGDWSEAYSLANALTHMGMIPFVERSRSKGWHIWVFSDEWVHAATMRRALKVAYSVIGLPAKEANPKQETLKEGQLGNYVRLPYKGALGGGPLTRQVICRDWSEQTDGEPCPFPMFMESHHETPHQVFEKWAEKYYEPPKRTVEFTQADVDTERLIVSLPPKVQQFIRKGPKNDRSAGMVALAHNLRQCGATPDEAMAILVHVDAAWGKGYTDRVNGIQFLEDIIVRVYG